LRIIFIGGSVLSAVFVMQTVDVVKGNSANVMGLLFVFLIGMFALIFLTKPAKP